MLHRPRPVSLFIVGMSVLVFLALAAVGIYVVISEGPAHAHHSQEMPSESR